MDLNMRKEDALLLAQELWKKIMETGYNALSKNDFYDFVLYLFNKYDASHFLTNRSNYENSQLLRVTDQKIKTAQENIFLKYYGDAEKAEIPLRFLESAATGALQQETDGTRYTFILEDLRTRRYLDYLLKRDKGTALDYQFNPEKVTLDIKAFYSLCSAVIADLREKTGDTAEGLEQVLESRRQGAENRMLARAIIKGVLSVAESVTPLSVQTVKDTLGVIGGYFRNRQKTMIGKG